MMVEAIIFADAHVSEGDAQAAARVNSFLLEVCPTARRVFILGDLFDFWFGSKQARHAPYRTVLESMAKLAAGGTEVTFYHGNRDFYVNEEMAARFSFRLVRDYSIEDICGSRMLLCHGDMLCSNDVSYHRMRAILRHPMVEATLKHLPPFLARAIAKGYRAYSKRTVKKKSQWVLGLDEGAVLEHFAFGAEGIVCGHTHTEEKLVFQTPEGAGELYKLGDFGTDGSYIECDAEGFRFRKAARAPAQPKAAAIEEGS